jgi:glycosyltransferase involved in cell wall biosynthesis
MRLAYVTTYDPQNIRNWSGIGYYMARSLKTPSLSVEHIGPLQQKASTTVRTKKYFYNRLIKKRYLLDREPLILKHYARQVAEKLCQFKADAIFSPGSIPIAYLDCKQPIAFWTDATFAGMVDFYPAFKNLCTESIKNGNKMERAALNRASLAIYSSDWAARSAIENYGIEPEKVKVVPFGANLERTRTLHDIKTFVEERSSKVCKLLFLGVDWHRKGGETALRVAAELNRAGLKTELTIVGCEPEPRTLPSFVKHVGFVSKKTPDGETTIGKLLAESHFLILPSRAEAFGIVFCEAASFGVPSIATAVGGIPTIIKNDINGRIFAEEAGISQYCDYVLNLFANFGSYKELALSSFNEYQSRLNWTVAGKTVRRLLREVVPNSRPLAEMSHRCAVLS